MFAMRLSHPICQYSVLSTCLSDGSGARLLSAQFGCLSPLSAPETIRLLLARSSSMLMVSGQSSGSLLVKNAAPLLWSMMSSWCLIAVLFAGTSLTTLMVIVSNPVHATLTYQECFDDKVLAVSSIHNWLQLFTIQKQQKRLAPWVLRSSLLVISEHDFGVDCVCFALTRFWVSVKLLLLLFAFLQQGSCYMQYQLVLIVPLLPCQRSHFWESRPLVKKLVGGACAGLQCWLVLWKHQRSLCWSSSAGLCHDDTRGCVVVLLDLQLASGYWSLASWYRRLRTSLSSVILGWTWPSLAVKKLIWWLGVGHDGPHGVGKEGVVVLVWYGQQRKVCPAKSWVHNQNAITVIGYSWYLLVRGSLRQLIAINNNNNNNSSANSASPTAGLSLSLSLSHSLNVHKQSSSGWLGLVGTTNAMVASNWYA
ncbi:hypothetical protein MP228_003703 [Amoeboaphelidium protococcarum]|nr:hypothetical protein MP228_003703 [Amoeboaphelidium protococcarum]